MVETGPGSIHRSSPAARRAASVKVPKSASSLSAGYSVTARRKGGLAAFTTEELEGLQKVYQRLTTLDAPMLREACTRAEHRTIPDIVFVLQNFNAIDFVMLATGRDFVAV